MDAYITKPIDREELFRVLEGSAGVVDAASCRVSEKRLEAASTVDAASCRVSEKRLEAASTVDAAAPGEPAEAAVDLAAVRDQIGGDTALLDELVGLFLEQCRTTLAEIDAAAGRGEARPVERSAHRLKGAAAQFGARGVARAALELESLGRQDDLAALDDARAALAHEIARAEEAIAALNVGQASCLPIGDLQAGRLHH